jgi:hypothetical protein
LIGSTLIYELRAVLLNARKFEIADFKYWRERFQLESGQSGLAGGLSNNANWFDHVICCCLAGCVGRSVAA